MKQLYNFHKMFCLFLICSIQNQLSYDVTILIVDTNFAHYNFLPPKFEDKNSFFKKQLNRHTHADIMALCIQNEIENVPISCLSVLNSATMSCSKQHLLTSLESVDLKKFDVVLFASIISDFDPIKNIIDAQILFVLQQCNIVIVPAGNNGLSLEKKPFFSYFFFSVAGCEEINNQFLISAFSGYTKKHKPNFAMSSNFDQYQGTSIAAAKFAGNVAQLLKQSNKKIKKDEIKTMCKKFAIRVAKSDFKKVRYGVVDFEQIGRRNKNVKTRFIYAKNVQS